jgi:hypothetical protein
MMPLHPVLASFRPDPHSRRGRLAALAMVASWVGCSLVDLGDLSGGEGGAGGAGASVASATPTSSAVSTASSTTGGPPTGGGGGRGGAGGSGGAGGADIDCGPETDLETDPLHCGSCGHDCLGGDCEDGRCQPVALSTGLERPRYLAVDDAFVYVTDEVAAPLGGVWRVDKYPGSLPLRLATQSRAWSVAVHDDTVFYSTPVEGDGVFAVPRDGRAAPSLVFESGVVAEAVIDPASGDLFMAEYTAPDFIDDLVLRATVDGDLFAVAPASQCERLVVKGDRVFMGGASVRRVSTTGEQLTLLTDLPARRIAVDDEWVYFMSYMSSDILAVDVDGIEERLVSTTPEMPFDGDIAVDDTHVYWTTIGGPGRVLRADKDGSEPEELAADQPRPTGIALDERAIYWVVSEPGPLSGRVMKLAK